MGRRGKSRLGMTHTAAQKFVGVDIQEKVIISPELAIISPREIYNASRKEKNTPRKWISTSTKNHVELEHGLVEGVGCVTSEGIHVEMVSVWM
jgi:hypothetical protein